MSYRRSIEEMEERERPHLDLARELAVRVEGLVARLEERGPPPLPHDRAWLLAELEKASKRLSDYVLGLG